MSDFEAGINAAKTAIDFTEQRVNFSNYAVSVQKQTYSIKAFYPVITPHQNRIFVLRQGRGTGKYKDYHSGFASSGFT